MEDKLIMKEASQRSILRWIHIIFSIPILGYIYSPFEEIPKYADRGHHLAPKAILGCGKRTPQTVLLSRTSLAHPPEQLRRQSN